MNNIYFLIAFAFLSLSLSAGNDNTPIGARAAGLSNAAVTLSDVWSAHHNQAGLGFIKEFSAGAYYESRYLLPELALGGAVIAAPLKNNKGTFGFSFRNFGYQLYSESKLGLGFGRALNDQLSIGVQLNYHQVRIADVYGNRSVVTAEAGIQYKVANKLTLGAHVFNPNRSKLTDLDADRLPAVIRLGLQYEFSKSLFLVAETEKDTYNPAVFRGGIEYRIAEIFYLRAGFSTNPFANSFGFGLLLKRLKLDFAGNFHPVLGFTPQTSLTYQISK
ncbi:MAG: hypothetical protein WED33_08925 [Bacteroidia bacterium]